MSLQLQDITHRYGSHESLRRVSIRVEPGDCYGFIGHNGAGKTTTLRIALGLMRQRSGRVFVDGFDATQFPREARARMGGLVEVPGFYGFATGFENLVQLGRLQGMSGEQAKREAVRQLERVGLTAAGGRKVKGYSQGRRRLNPGRRPCTSTQPDRAVPRPARSVGPGLESRDPRAGTGPGVSHRAHRRVRRD